jgi:putative FmdB family regulatory protein
MLYEYKCQNCGVLEIQQSIKDEPLQLCPQCGSPISRIITGGNGVIFNCGGFYSKPIANIKE